MFTFKYPISGLRSMGMVNSKPFLNTTTNAKNKYIHKWTLLHMSVFFRSAQYSSVATQWPHQRQILSTSFWGTWTQHWGAASMARWFVTLKKKKKSLLWRTVTTPREKERRLVFLTWRLCVCVDRKSKLIYSFDRLT